jgi:heat shock protein HtpX
MKIYVAKNGKRIGPFSQEEARQMTASGELAPTDLAWHQGVPDWVALSTLIRDQPSIPPPAPPVTASRSQSIRRAELTADDIRAPGEAKWFSITMWTFGSIVLIMSILTEGWLFVALLPAVGIAAIAIKRQESLLLGNAVHISSEQLPAVHYIATKVAERLHMRLPNLYLIADDSLNAFSFGFLGTKSVVIHSGVAEAMDEHELAAILGHEFAHIKCQHTTWSALTGSTEVVSVPFISQVFGFIFCCWSRKAEFTADRGALIAAGDFKPAATALAKLATGKHMFQEFSLDRFLQQKMDLTENEVTKFSDFFNSHPSLVDRIHHLRRFSESDDFKRLPNVG